MSDFDLDRLGDVWRQRPDPAELERIRRTAETVRRRARWAQRADVVAALLVAGVVLFLVSSSPQTDTLLVGGAAILVLLTSHFRNRRLRDAELRALTGSTEQMLDQSIERTQATLKRTRFQLVALPPSLLLGLVVGAVADRRSGGGLLERVMSEPLLGLAMAASAILFLAIVSLYFTRSARRTREELERLLALRDSYRQEREFGPAE